VEQACDAIVRVSKRIAPNAKDCATMHQGYQTYQKIYPALRELA
jgi:hypothetical protein